MSLTLCPGCGENTSLDGLKVGDRMDCANCAGLTLAVKEQHGSLTLVEIRKVSCPSCDEVLEVPDALQPGDTIECWGRDYVLSYEFGAFALMSL